MYHFLICVDCDALSSQLYIRPKTIFLAETIDFSSSSSSVVEARTLYPHYLHSQVRRHTCFRAQLFLLVKNSNLESNQKVLSPEGFLSCTGCRYDRDLKLLLLKSLSIANRLAYLSSNNQLDLETRLFHSKVDLE